MFHCNHSYYCAFQKHGKTLKFKSQLAFHDQSHQTGLVISPGRAHLELSHDLKHKLYPLSNIA